MTDRRVEAEQFEDSKNALRHWARLQRSLQVTTNIIVLTFSKFLPLKLKNRLLRLAGVDIGENSSIAFGTMFDIFWPEKIKIGENTIIGYNTTILGP